MDLKMNFYFGPDKFRKQWETQAPAPVGEKCIHCDEEIIDSDMGNFGPSGAIHHECQIRIAIGSVGHQMGKCSCFGGTEEDPEGMTKRQAAIVATKLFYKDLF